MRLKCEFKTEKIPVANRMMFVSLIKDALCKVNQEYFDKLYKFEEKNNKKIKPFSFAVMLKDFEMKGEEISIRDRMVLNITTVDYEFGINIYNGILNTKTFKYKDFVLERLKISLVKEKMINEEQVVFKTMSPICIKDKANNFLAPDDLGYEEELNYIVDKALRSYRGYGLKQRLRFEKVLMKKVVVKEQIRAFSEIAGKDTFYVNAYSGIFKLSGDVEDLNFVYQSGIGFRKGQGFGMLEVV